MRSRVKVSKSVRSERPVDAAGVKGLAVRLVGYIMREKVDFRDFSPQIIMLFFFAFI